MTIQLGTGKYGELLVRCQSLSPVPRVAGDPEVVA